MDGRDGRVLGVLGAGGGLGSSTLVAALATRAATAGQRVVAVEGEGWSDLLALRLAIELEPGLHWEDLAGLRGDVDAAGLVRGLPTTDEGVAVLGWRGPWGETGHRAGLVRALATAADLVVCDLPRADGPAARAWWRGCDTRVLLVADGIDGCAAGARVVDEVEPDLVVLRAGGQGRGRRMGREQLEAGLGAPVVALLGDDRAVDRALCRGEPVGRGGVLAACADRVLAAVLEAAR